MNRIAKAGSVGVLFSLTFCMAAIGQTREKALNELADAERSFAAETVKVGFHDGFIKYFADDGIGFGPHPERTKEVLQKRPAGTGARTVIFNWAPMFGDISQAGDMGYTTGPVLYTNISANPKPPRHGVYFSVWQKQSDGTWKVVIDMGVDTPKAIGSISTEFMSAGRVVTKRKFAAIGAKDLAALESKFARYIGEHGMAKAYANWLE